MSEFQVFNKNIKISDFQRGKCSNNAAEKKHFQITYSREESTSLVKVIIVINDPIMYWNNIHSFGGGCNAIKNIYVYLCV